MRRKKGKKANENWTREETLNLIKNRAVSEVEKQNKLEADLKKKGYKKILVDHPTSPRCQIEKWVKK